MLQLERQTALSHTPELDYHSRRNNEKPSRVSTSPSSQIMPPMKGMVLWRERVAAGALALPGLLPLLLLPLAATTLVTHWGCMGAGVLAPLHLLPLLLPALPVALPLSGLRNGLCGRVCGCQTLAGGPERGRCEGTPAVAPKPMPEICPSPATPLLAAPAKALAGRRPDGEFALFGLVLVRRGEAASSPCCCMAAASCTLAACSLSRSRWLASSSRRAACIASSRRQNCYNL